MAIMARARLRPLTILSGAMDPMQCGRATDCVSELANALPT